MKTALDRRAGTWRDVPHPFDEPDAAWAQFLSKPEPDDYRGNGEERTSVGSDVAPEMRSSDNIADFYASWQVLEAAEAANMNLRVWLDWDTDGEPKLASDKLWPTPRQWLITESTARNAVKAIRAHSAALDCIVWAGEEADRSWLYLTMHLPNGTVLSDAQIEGVRAAREQAARQAQARFGVGQPELVALLRMLAERWIEWGREGRPLIADAYKAYAATTVRCLQYGVALSFNQISAAVGNGGGTWQPLLDSLWPDWLGERRERMRLTIEPSLQDGTLGGTTQEDVDAFLDFVEREGQVTLHLALEGLERHSFEASPAPNAGVGRELQNLAVAAEHAIRAMGRNEDQLIKMFIAAWSGTNVGAIAKAKQDLARRSGQSEEDRLGMMRAIQALRTRDGDHSLAADLLMTHRLRGAVHHTPPDVGEQELQDLAVAVLRAVVATFARTQAQHAGAQAPH